MLDQGVDVNSSNQERMDTTVPGNRIPGKDFSVKILSNVAARGDTQLFDHLVSRGADPHRSLALHAVSRCKDSGKSRAMVDHLLDKHHMNIEADSRALRDLLFSRDHGTPLHCAVHCRNLTTLDHLLTRGADPKSAVKYVIGNILFESYLPALVPLLKAGADATSALGSAWETKNVEAARVCLAHGADPNRVIEEQRARDVRVRARREPGWVDDFEEEEDSDSADDDEERAKARAEMRALLQSVEPSRKDNSAKQVTRASCNRGIISFCVRMYIERVCQRLYSLDVLLPATPQDFISMYLLNTCMSCRPPMSKIGVA